MLNPNNDRLDYGQVLAPPANYHLDFAVGTTYSLDLDALVGACIALGLSEETDSDLMKNPVCLLEALRTTGDKIALFCEGGQIHLPNSVTPLYILLEKIVFQVAAAKRRGIAKFPSFHPKFWLIRYVDENKTPLYRVVVLSRNLTFDRSWDITFCMDGTKKSKVTDKNYPIGDFLSYLVKQLPVNDNASAKKKKINAMARELRNIHFKLNSKEFYDFDFIPVGIKSSEGGFHSIENYPLFNDTFHEILVMSPFISNSIIKHFNDRNTSISHTDYMLITRASELGKLKPEDCANFDIYTMKDAIVDGESAISEENTAIQKQDIHAKVFMVRKYSDSDLYLGSLNASHNALYGNIEFMIRLRGKKRYLNLEKLTENLFGTDESESPFQKVSLVQYQDEEKNDTSHALDSVIKELNRLNPTAVIKANEDLYDICVSFPVIETEYKITISPLLSNKTAELSEDVIFSSMELTQLSEFYKISVSDNEKTVSRVIIIPTENMPEEREKAVVSSVVNDKNCFYRYIAFLLGDNYILSALEADNTNGFERSSGSMRTMQIPALYEKMLQTAATFPERFREIDYLIKAISADGVVPEYFEELYTTFKKAVKL